MLDFDLEVQWVRLNEWCRLFGHNTYSRQLTEAQRTSKLENVPRAWEHGCYWNELGWIFVEDTFLKSYERNFKWFKVLPELNNDVTSSTNESFLSVLLPCGWQSPYGYSHEEIIWLSCGFVNQVSSSHLCYHISIIARDISRLPSFLSSHHSSSPPINSTVTIYFPHDTTTMGFFSRK